ncbi:MoaD/ThiS family protein [Exiguobacterium aurantiacum]|uniref:Molybdopterin synthase sulfur carrier subunit n=1 Tax=Exiguobacterium aurantiacum TaxID=33987 RepID=A0A377FYF6_9BACL|nr:MoaD/ThiS family protein [Exiguobacterium aurantiacum]STO09465.1 Sulfur carrier protein moaD [Exiguobacterium aurantiacum]
MIEVLCFAHVAEELAVRSYTVSAPQTIAALRADLADRGVSGAERLMFAVNERYEMDDYMIEDGDTVAVIPMVSGG